MISNKCELGEHFEANESGVVGCNAAIIIGLADNGAPNKWLECECNCHALPRREMIEAWLNSPFSQTSESLVIS